MKICDVIVRQTNADKYQNYKTVNTILEVNMVQIITMWQEFRTALQ